MAAVFGLYRVACFYATARPSGRLESCCMCGPSARGGGAGADGGGGPDLAAGVLVRSGGRGAMRVRRAAGD
eukprot:5287899-Prymnesium_polylepis.2